MIQTIEYPPYPYLYMLAKYAPKAIRTYLDMWKLRDDDCVARVRKSDITDLFGQHINSFTSSLRMLVDEQLVSVEDSAGVLNIHMVDYQDTETFYEPTEAELRDESGPLREVPINRRRI